MPQFDLRYINVAEYQNTNGAISYGPRNSFGEAMSVNLELKHAEGRLYAEGKLDEYIKLATGGTISVATKYIPQETQILLFGATEYTRTVSSKQVKSLRHTTSDVSPYVGLSFYAPDKIDGMNKYTCVFVPKVSFGPPSMAYETKGQNIVFKTPTTTGEFLADDSTDELLIEVAICDTPQEAKSWCDLVLGGAA